MEIDVLTSSFLGLRDKLHHIALRYLGSDEDAKDALQDTWLKLRDNCIEECLHRPSEESKRDLN